MENILHFSRAGCFNHQEDGRFTGAYYFNIEDIQPFMELHGFESLELVGSNVGAILNNESWNYWREKGDLLFGFIGVIALVISGIIYFYI